MDSEFHPTLQYGRPSMRGASPANWSDVRDDFVPTAHFTSVEFLNLERTRLWPRAWQAACRLEDLTEVGAHVTYEIVAERIILTRTGERTIKAFCSACPHCGGRLSKVVGGSAQFQCLRSVRKPATSVEISAPFVAQLGPLSCVFGLAELEEVAADIWAGFVFINRDVNCEPLAEFLYPVEGLMRPLSLQDLRCQRYGSVKVPCNWKLALGAFNECYNALLANPAIADDPGEYRGVARLFGRHSMLAYPASAEGANAPELTARDAIGNAQFRRLVHQMVSMTLVEARDLDEGAAPPRVGFGETSADARPAPALEPALLWHIFPNLIIIPDLNGSLVYRVLPDPISPEQCEIEAYVLESAGQIPDKIDQSTYRRGENDWQLFQYYNPFLRNELDNIVDSQAGMRSTGFRGARINPIRDSTIYHFHREIVEFTKDSQADMMS